MSSAGAPKPQLGPVSPPPPATGDTQRHKRHLRNYIIDRNLQLRYIAVVSVLSAVIVAALGYLVYDQSTSATKKIVRTLDGPGMEWLGDTSVIKAALKSADQNLLLVMATVGLGLVAVLTLYMVVMTHHVAGPLYKVLRYFDQIRDGKLPRVEELRRGDQLQDFFEKFKQMNEALRARVQDEVALIEAFLAACRTASVPRTGELGHHLEDLERLKRDKEASLG